MDPSYFSNGFEGNDHGVTLLLECRSRVRKLLAMLDNVRVMRADSMPTMVD
jgi:hypothetical protein